MIIETFNTWISRFYIAIDHQRIVREYAIEPFEVAKPEIVAGMEYLNEYDALKTYVNRSTSPVFVGCRRYRERIRGSGSDVPPINANFDQITAGNAMKYGSVVQNNGSMDFGTVSSQLVAAAKGRHLNLRAYPYVARTAKQEVS